MLQKIVAFFSTSYGVFAALLAGVGVIWGGVKTGREIRKWISDGLRRRRERRSVPERTLAMVQRIQEEQTAKDAAISERLDKFEERFDKLGETLGTAINGVDSQVGTLQLEKMTWGYVHYGIERHEISLATRTSLELMYDQYTTKGAHNHIPQDFKEVIRRAPLKEAGDAGSALQQ